MERDLKRREDAVIKQESRADKCTEIKQSQTKTELKGQICCLGTELTMTQTLLGVHLN